MHTNTKAMIKVHQREYSTERVEELLRYLHSYYEQGMSVGQAFDEAAHAIREREFPDRRSANSILDGARIARNAELAQINERIFIKLRDFFDEQKPSK